MLNKKEKLNSFILNKFCRICYHYCYFEFKFLVSSYEYSHLRSKLAIFDLEHIIDLISTCGQYQCPVVTLYEFCIPMSIIVDVFFGIFLDG